MPGDMPGRIVGKFSVPGYVAHGHNHRIIILDRKYFIIRQRDQAILLNELLCNREKLDAELGAGLNALVDYPLIAVVVRIDIRMAKFFDIRITQPREAAKDKYIPDYRGFIIRQFDVDNRMQFFLR